MPTTPPGNTIFTNPIDAAGAEAHAYIEAVLELLGHREPLAVLEALPGSIEELMSGLANEALRRPEAVGKWSMLEVVRHLVDSEWVWAYRLRQVLAEDRPTLTGYDQDRWADRLRYRDADPTVSLDELRSLRAANLRLIRALGPEELRRVGVHSERGEESVAHMIRLYAGHDLVHRRQLERIRAAVVGDAD